MPPKYRSSKKSKSSTKKKLSSKSDSIDETNRDVQTPDVRKNFDEESIENHVS